MCASIYLLVVIFAVTNKTKLSLPEPCPNVSFKQTARRPCRRLAELEHETDSLRKELAAAAGDPVWVCVCACVCRASFLLVGSRRS